MSIPTRPAMALAFVHIAVFTASAAPSAASTAPAALDPESRTPYVWRIILDAPKHPALTPALRAQISRDLRTALQPLLGEGGTLEVIDLADTPESDWQPLWKRYSTQGWPALDLAEFRNLTGIKTHFLKIQARDDGSFRIESRQHDGSTGLTSPLVRKKDSAAGETLGRLAGLLIGKDFGPVGTVEPNPDDAARAHVRFRAGELGSFPRWVKEGDILAFAVIYRPSRQATPQGAGKERELPPRLAGKPQEFTLLRVRNTQPDGNCHCDVLTRFKQPFVGGKDVVGYRCMKLTTSEQPVRVRILGTDGQPPPLTSPLDVWATDTTFTPTPTPRDTLERQEGVFRSGRPLRGVACVIVRLGVTRTEPFPLPILGDEPITLRFAIRPEEVAKAEHEQACERLRGRAVDALSMQAELTQGLTRLIQNNDANTALARATAGLAAAVKGEKELSAELELLRKQPAADDYTRRLLASAAEHLAQVRARVPELEKTIVSLQAVVARANDPAKFEREFRASELTRQIGEHIARGEVPQALDIYDQLFELTQEPRVKMLKENLATQWATRSDEHAKARQFLLEVWRKAATREEISAGVARLPETIAVLEKHDDRLGARLVKSTIESAYTRLQEIVDRLDANSETDRPVLQQIKNLSERLQKVDATNQALMKKLEPK